MTPGDPHGSVGTRLGTNVTSDIVVFVVVVVMYSWNCEHDGLCSRCDVGVEARHRVGLGVG